MRIRRSRVEFTVSGPRLPTKSMRSNRGSSRVWPFARGDDTSSMVDLMGDNASPPYPHIQQTDEFRVDMQENVPTLPTDVELTQARTNNYAGSPVMEQHTFADELMSITLRDYRG